MSLAATFTINGYVFTKLFDDPDRGAVYKSTTSVGSNAPIMLTVKHETPSLTATKGTVRHLVSLSIPFNDPDLGYYRNDLRATVNFTIAHPMASIGGTELNDGVKTMLLLLATGATAANAFTGQVLNSEL